MEAKGELQVSSENRQLDWVPLLQRPKKAISNENSVTITVQNSEKILKF
jgi:hypothetical protein